MQIFRLNSENDFNEWRDMARQALLAGIKPDAIDWSGPKQSHSLFQACEPPLVADYSRPLLSGGDASRPAKVTVPRSFTEQADAVICHRDPTRFARLYKLAWRIQTEKGLMQNEADDDVRWFEDRARTIRRDIHKMRAFVRFRKIDLKDGEWFIAWFEPDHLIVERNAAFFQKRFTGMRFSILTPERSMHWNTRELRFGNGCHREDAPERDELEEHWKHYYANIFNPARLKVEAMTSEMPRKYWKNLPEAQLIPELIAKAQTRAEAMCAAPATDPTFTAMALAARGRRELSQTPPDFAPGLAAINDELKKCNRCALAKCASQTVPGAGPGNARLMVIGEQPGDEEDLSGIPFVGPAGKLLNKTLASLQIDRNSIYLTNAVKHFKYTTRGKRRIHARPSGEEIEHCRWWLRQEIEAVGPVTILALGKSAAMAVLGRKSVPLDHTDSVATLGAASVFVTYHPAYLLRISEGPGHRQAADLFGQTILAAFRNQQLNHQA